MLWFLARRRPHLAYVSAGLAIVAIVGLIWTVIAALAFGTPQVVLALGADQPLNADRCVALGVGVALNALDVTPTAIGEPTDTLLTTETYRARANQVRAEIASLPDARHAATLLEGLVGI